MPASSTSSPKRAATSITAKRSTSVVLRRSPSSDAFGHSLDNAQNEFGGSIGGPIKKNRSFFYVGAEQDYLNIPYWTEFEPQPPGTVVPPRSCVFAAADRRHTAIPTLGLHARRLPAESGEHAEPAIQLQSRERHKSGRRLDTQHRAHRQQRIADRRQLLGTRQSHDAVRLEQSQPVPGAVGAGPARPASELDCTRVGHQRLRRAGRKRFSQRVLHLEHQPLQRRLRDHPGRRSRAFRR